MKPTLIKLYSENNDFQYIETLKHNRTKRAKSGEFFVEGVRAINQALLHQWELTAFIYSRDARLSDWAEATLANSRAKRHYELPAHLMENLSDKEERSELLALAAMPPNDLTRIPERETLFVVVLDRPSSPGNLGTIIRSCDALGVDGLVMTGHAADLYDPETIRATTGSFFSVPTIVLPSHNELIPWLNEIKARFPGLRVVGTSAKAQTPIHAHDFRTATLLVIGNETRGLSENYREICDEIVTIPMFGAASSMNVPCAASICLYEVPRQRGASHVAG
jgi:23S rRNA (uridine2479-2'-O)-methyltransferase